MYKHSAQQFFLLSGISEGSTSNISITISNRTARTPHQTNVGPSDFFAHAEASFISVDYRNYRSFSLKN